ncbi:MAG: polyisoprenoid-binding protein YceI [Candidatus Paceibacteria bacterium]|jgi:polyisoprenoid-binding protein YceI
MKKVIVTIVLIIAVILAIVLATSGAPKDIERADIKDVEVNKGEVIEESGVSYDLSKLDFKFIGFGPGKSHEGTFHKMSIKNIEHNGDHFTGGTITFDNSSIDAGIGKLNTDLCTEIFFNCAKYPKSTFKLTKAERVSETKGNVTGVLTIKGVPKEVTFPVAQEGGIISADFIIDTEPFGLDVILADNEVQIKFSAEI